MFVCDVVFPFIHPSAWSVIVYEILHSLPGKQGDNRSICDIITYQDPNKWTGQILPHCFALFQVLSESWRQSVLPPQSLQSESWAGQKVVDKYLGDRQFWPYRWRGFLSFYNVFMYIMFEICLRLRNLFPCGYWLLIVIPIGERGRNTRPTMMGTPIVVLLLCLVVINWRFVVLECTYFQLVFTMCTRNQFSCATVWSVCSFKVNNLSFCVVCSSQDNHACVCLQSIRVQFQFCVCVKYSSALNECL